ncbi:MAG: gluconokinase [Anaerolineales bacterium]
MRVIIVMGVSGSGKTTIGTLLAEALGWPFFEGDDLHPQANVRKMAAGVPLTDEDRLPWLDKIRALVGTLVESDQHAVIAASVLKRSYRQHLDWEPIVRYVYLRGSVALIRKRLRQRQGHFMGTDMLASQMAVLEPPEEAIVVDIDAPAAAVVDSILSGLPTEGGLS